MHTMPIMRIYTTAWGVLMSLSGAWADLPLKLKQTLQMREHVYHNQRLVFHAEVRYEYYKPKHPTKTYQYLLEVLRTPEAIKAIKSIIRPDNKGSAIAQMQGDALADRSSCYMMSNLRVLVEPNVVIEEPKKSKRVVGYTAFVSNYRNPYVGSDPNFACHDIRESRGIFTVGLDISKLYRAKWGRIEEYSDRWILYGKSDPRNLDPSIPKEVAFPEIELTAVLRKPDALVERLEVRVHLPTNGSTKRWYTDTYEVIHTKQVGKIKIPSVIIYNHRTSNNSIRIVKKYTLLNVEALKVPVKLEVPEGGRVVDERVNNTNYQWQGRLLSEEEVKRLALQQGRLVPEETPHRRYSPVLFLPAILFFAGAFYLYWRQRRK